ncbi:MAG: hypothetical protein V4633_11770 [Pseudomonadota bacterium]
MNFLNTVLLALSLLAAPALAADDASHFQLSPTILQKLMSAEAEMKLLQKPDEGLAAPDEDKSIAAAIRRIDADPKTTAVLAKHGLTSRDLVLSTHALYHAGMFVSTESTLDEKKRAALYQSYTSEQQANIDMIRAMHAAK